MRFDVEQGPAAAALQPRLRVWVDINHAKAAVVRLGTEQGANLFSQRREFRRAVSLGELYRYDIERDQSVPTEDSEHDLGADARLHHQPLEVARFGNR